MDTLPNSNITDSKPVETKNQDEKDSVSYYESIASDASRNQNGPKKSRFTVKTVQKEVRNLFIINKITRIMIY